MSSDDIRTGSSSSTKLLQTDLSTDFTVDSNGDESKEHEDISCIKYKFREDLAIWDSASFGTRAKYDVIVDTIGIWKSFNQGGGPRSCISSCPSGESLTYLLT